MIQQGTAINGATSSTYTIDKSLVGKYIYVVVTATKDNYNTATWNAKTGATENTTAAVAKQDLSVTATPYSAVYNGNTNYAKVQVTSSEWNGATIVSGTTTSYGTNVTTSGVKNTDYNLSPGYKDWTNGDKTVYFKVTGGTYYNDYTGNTTVTINKKSLTSYCQANI